LLAGRRLSNFCPVVRIFPKKTINDGNNYIVAHVPYEIPSAKEKTSPARWFHLPIASSAFRLYLVISRAPLPEVPTGKELSARCPDKADGCPLSESTWRTISNFANTEVRRISLASISDIKQTRQEGEAVSQEKLLLPDAPSPSNIFMNANPQTSLLMVKIDFLLK